MQRSLRYLTVVVLAATAFLLVVSQQESVSLEQEIQAALANRVDEAQNAIGIVVGILTAEGRTFLYDGMADRESEVEPGPNTMFRISGITSVFSSLLLADMAVQGELMLDDPISAFLPASVDVPTFDGQEITLADLATGTSGLPPRPEGYRGPPFGIQVQDLYDGLSSFSLTRAPGRELAGSPFEEALLVEALALHAGTSYQELLRTRIFDKLGMESTTYELTEEQRSRAAATYNAEFNARPSLGNGALDRGVGLYSTADDLLTFAAAFMGMTDHPLEPAMRQMVSVIRPASGHRSASSTNLGLLEIDGDVYFRSTGGYNHTASLAMHPERQRAVVVLANTPVQIDSIESISLHGVMREWPLLMHPPKQELVEVTIPGNLLDRYVGQYRLDVDDGRLTYTLQASVRREGERLVFTQSRGGPVMFEFDLGALSETEFFARGSDNWRFRFGTNDSGDVTRLTVIRSPGAPLSLSKVNEEP